MGVELMPEPLWPAWMDKPCRLWTRGSGYGDRRVNGRRVSVHRLAWEEAYGPIPPGLFVCHHCDTPPCYEPTHLFLGTHTENMRDAQAKGRLRNPVLYGAANPKSKLTLEQVAEIRATVRPLPRGRHGGGVLAAAHRYGMSRRAIAAILNGRTWSRP